MSKYESLFTQRVIESIENKRRDRRMTIDELCKLSRIGRNSYYAKIRGERCFNTEEVDAIAKTLECDPFIILEEAAAKSTPDPDNMSEEEKRDYAMAAYRKDSYHLVANRDKNKQAERDSYTDAGA